MLVIIPKLGAHYNDYKLHMGHDYTKLHRIISSQMIIISFRSLRQLHLPTLHSLIYLLACAHLLVCLAIKACTYVRTVDENDDPIVPRALTEKAADPHSPKLEASKCGLEWGGEDQVRQPCCNLQAAMLPTVVV